MRVAMVGCGAVAELFHLPVVAGNPAVELTLLVDRDLGRARELAVRYGPSVRVSDSVAAVPECADLAIVAVPHHLHAEVSIQLIAAGVHVLVDKPMALRATECDAMIDAAEARGVTLAVSMQRRFGNAAQLAKAWFDTGLLGRVRRVDLREGAIYGWPVRDPRMLSPQVGGGVVTGAGIHALDLLLWWLGDVQAVTYYDDAFGGVEADCEFHLKFADEAEGVLEFSRTRELRNSWIFECERGVLEIGAGLDAPVRLRLSEEAPLLSGQATPLLSGPETPWVHLHRQLDDVAEAIHTGRAPMVDGREGRRAVALFESAHAGRQPLRLPWLNLPQAGMGTAQNTQEVRASV